MKPIILKIFLIIIALTTISSGSITKIPIDSGVISMKGASSFTPKDYFFRKLPITDAGIYLFSTSFSISPNIESPYLYLGAMYFPTTIYLNGISIFEWGKLDGKGGMSNYSTEAIHLPKSLLKDNNILEVEFFTDGLTMSIADMWIGEKDNVVLATEFKNAFNITGIRLGTLTILIAFLISIVAIIFVKNDSRHIINFSLFSFVAFITFSGFIFNSSILNQIFITKIFRIGTVTLPILLFTMVTEFLNDYKDRFIKIIIGIINAIFVILILFSQSKFEVENITKIASRYFITPIVISIIIILIINYKKRKDLAFKVVAFNVALIIIGASNDLSSLFNNKIPSFWLIPYSYIITTISIALLIIWKNYNLYSENRSFQEKLMIKNDELQISNEKILIESKNRESFIKTMAHELKTPISGLLGGLETISSSELLPDRLQSQFDLLENSMHRLTITTSNIFSFIDSKNDNITILNHNFDIIAEVEKLIQYYREEARSKGISLILIKKKCIPKHIKGDEQHFLQVIDNILGNAIKFTTNGGVSCTLSYNTPYVVVSISDTGCGLSNDKKKILFEAFKSNDNFSFSKQYEGVGIGLAIADSATRAMGGSISVTSQKDKGSCFTVTIPMITSKSFKESLDNPKHVLVVEDNKINSLMVVKQLQKANFTATQAYNGQEAIDLVSKKKFDAILMDIQMPIMDGLIATKKIRERLIKIPIVALSANANREECIKAGMDEFLTKPISSNNITSVLIQLINHIN